MNAVIYLEGGGDSKELHVRCREGFRRLLEQLVPAGRMPRLVACGGRNDAFARFQTALRNAATGDFVALLIDSEEPLANIEATWAHLRARDGWPTPTGARDTQVLLMTTCMETWIVADVAALRAHYGSQLQISALPPLIDLEQRSRADIQDRLTRATRDCPNAYAKGKRSFVILAQINPTVLEQALPSFARAKEILNANL